MGSERMKTNTRFLYLCAEKFIGEHSQLSIVDVFGGFEIANFS